MTERKFKMTVIIVVKGDNDNISELVNEYTQNMEEMNHVAETQGGITVEQISSSIKEITNDAA